MTIRFRVKRDLNLVAIEHHGTIPDDEFLASYEKFFGSGTFDPSLNLFVDLRKADSTIRHPEVLQDLAESVSARYAGITTRPKVAVVAGNDLSFGLARMYEAFAISVSWDFMVFRILEAALAWFGLEENLLNRDDQDNQSNTRGT
jgi:hypothetical protein